MGCPMFTPSYVILAVPCSLLHPSQRIGVVPTPPAFQYSATPPSPTDPLTDKDAAAARERLEKDLHSTKAVLKQKTDQTEGVGSVVSDSHNRRGSSETEVGVME